MTSVPESKYWMFYSDTLYHTANILLDQNYMHAYIHASLNTIIFH